VLGAGFGFVHKLTDASIFRCRHSVCGQGPLEVRAYPLFV
jgi:hypothetical protein